MKAKINVPAGLYNKFSVPVEGSDTEYIIYLYFEQDVQTWYIRVVYGDIDTQFCGLTVAFFLFQEYRNLLPHCFFCSTVTGFNPDKATSFDPIDGDATLYICDWNERIQELVK